MLIEEFVDFRVQAGEAVRAQRERERALRADERGRWLRSPARRVRSRAGHAGDLVDAVDTVDAAALTPAATDAPAQPTAGEGVGASQAAHASRTTAERDER